MTSTASARGLAVLVAGLIATGAASCGGSSTSVLRAPTSSTRGNPPATSSIPASTAGSSTTQRSTSSAPAAHPKVRVTPATGLPATAHVQVHASGFSPNQPLQVIECADKGRATGAGDCNLAGMLGVTSNADGRLHVTFTVVVGPFGANRIVCRGSERCLVSVTQASPSPSENAEAGISFAQRAS